MNFTLVDWFIIVALMLFIIYVSIRSKRYTRSVADFLAANRCAGRYLLGIAHGEANMGAISVVALMERTYAAGFSPQFWNFPAIPLGMLITLSGFVVYRYRQTRALTLAQFFEMRYSRKFRIFAGIIAWFSGILNFGIFPMIGARFFTQYCGLTSHVLPLGPIELNITHGLVMLMLVLIALFFTFVGGQISVLVTDFWQGFLCTIVIGIIMLFCLLTFSWGQISDALVIASKPGQSLVDPFDIGNQDVFNFYYFLIAWLYSAYMTNSWQGAGAYMVSATSAHEQKMANIVGGFRTVMVATGLTLIPICALTYMNHPDYANGSAEVNQALESAFPGDGAEAIASRNQIRVPLAMGNFLPIGLIGAFAAAMLAFFISTHTTYLHSWGSIFIQDVISPMRKKPLPQQSHLKYLRWSIVGVAGFIFLWGLLFPIKEFILLYQQITGAIFIGGAGSVIIGGLYWKRGTTAGAWAAMIIGSASAVGSIFLRIIWEDVPMFVEFAPQFPINAQVMSFYCCLSAIIAYVLVSILGKRTVADMDHLLHRGKYAVKEEADEVKSHAQGKQTAWYWRILGVNSREFSKIDKGIYLFGVIYSSFGFFSFLILCILQAFDFMTKQRWLVWWKIFLFITLGVMGFAAICVCIGGLIDLRKMYRRLTVIERDETDDGRVTERYISD